MRRFCQFSHTFVRVHSGMAFLPMPFLLSKKICLCSMVERDQMMWEHLCRSQLSYTAFKMWHEKTPQQKKMRAPLPPWLRFFAMFEIAHKSTADDAQRRQVFDWCTPPPRTSTTAFPF